MKYLKAFAVFALALTVTVPAFAETQNVKVSGSIDAYWFSRNDFDLQEGNDAGDTPAFTAVQGESHAGSAIHRTDNSNFAMTITQIQVAADLTDNVSTVVNLINMRDWNADQYNTGATATVSEFDIDLDLAYVQMKEIFYAPLTLTIGRQDLLFGRGNIVGWNPQDPNASILAEEFTQVQSFDAFRATLDFAPWTIDWVSAKITENSHDSEDDRDLHIAYINYKFAEYNALADVYWTGEYDRATLHSAAGTIGNTTQTLGGRVQFDPVTPMTLGAELAYQFGSYTPAITSPERDRDAWFAEVFGEYRFDNPWKPTLGVQYVLMTGEENLTTTATGDYGSWNGSFRGPIYGWIHDYKEVYYATAQTTDQQAGQNLQHVSIYGAMNPMEDLRLTANYWHFWTDEDVHTVPASLASAVLDDTVGDELDLAAIYSYTEDVTFTFYANWFFPGDHYNEPTDDSASEYISEVKVTF